MFGYNPFYGGNNNAYYRALAEEEAARRQYAAARAAEEQAQRRAQQQAIYDRLYGGSYYPTDEDEDYGAPYYGYPHGDSYYHTPRTSREQAYRDALLARARQEDARQAALERERERERELEQLRLQELRRRQVAEEERKRELLERQRQLELEQRRRRRQSAGLDDSRADELEQFYRMMGLPVPQRQPRSQEPSTRKPTRIPVSGGGRSQTQPPADRAPAPATPPLIKAEPTYTTEHATAASKIQDAYRAHAARRHALSELSNISNSFSTLQASFRPPEHLDYIADGSTVHVPTAPAPFSSSSSEAPEESNEEGSPRPKLAYTPNNAPVHAYEDALGKLLSKIDAIESGGDASVRAARKALARAVEADAERVDGWRSRVWKAYVESKNATTEASATEQAKAPEQDMKVDSVETNETDAAAVNPSLADAPAPESESSPAEVAPSESAVSEPIASEPISSEPANAPEPSPSSEVTDTTSVPPPSSPEDDFVVVDTPAEPTPAAQPNSQLADGIDDVSIASLTPAPSSPMTTSPADPMDVFVDAMTSKEHSQPAAPGSYASSDAFTDADRSSTPLPLTSALSTSHTSGVDPTVAVPEDAQHQADDVSHAEGSLHAHRGVAAPLENSTRVPDGIASGSDFNNEDRERERRRQLEAERAEGKENDTSAVNA